MHQISCANLDTPGSVLASLFTHFLASIFTRQCEFGNVAYPADRSNDVLDNHVKIDMIVVGSGSSGSVVASRLSEVSKWNVLLIEAGDDPSVSSYVPAMAFALQKTSIDWAYQNEKQPGVCEGLRDGVCNIPRGKALGGSSNLNAMMYLVGNPNDHNSWGNIDWNFKNTEKYFHKSFKDYYYAGFANKSFSHQHYFNTNHMTKTIESATKEIHLDKLKYKNKNINPNKAGTLHIKTNIKDGERLNIARAFLAPVKERPNLFVMKNTLVTKILLENKKAIGVEIYKGEKYYEVKFNKELIISAGSVNTPQLLFQSGIGDEEQLKKENIDVKVNLPSVGKNLYDHPLFVVPVELSRLSSKKRGKSGKVDDSELGNEGNRGEHRDHRKPHEDEFVFGEGGNEEKNKNEKKKHSGKGKSKKNHKHKGPTAERNETDINEGDLVSEERQELTPMSPVNPAVIPLNVANSEEDEKPPPTTTSSTTSTTSTTTETTRKTKVDYEEDDVNYDEAYEEDDEEEEEKPRKHKRSPARNKNKKNKNQPRTTEFPQIKNIPNEPPKDFPPSEEIYKYIMEKAGPLSGIGSGDYVTFIDTTGKSPNNPNVLIMYCFFPQADKSGLRTLLHAYNWSPHMIDAVYQKQGDILLMIPMLLKPISYGNITFTNNVGSRGKIFLNYFDQEEDLNTLVRGVRFIEKFIDTKSFRKHNAKVVKVPDVACDDFPYNSDDYWRCSLKRRASSCYHLSSTARMGDNILSSVVSYKLQIHGLENVRIADASVMPYTVGANIHATCVMIGEKCADLIKEEWKEKE